MIRLSKTSGWYDGEIELSFKLGDLGNEMYCFNFIYGGN